MNTKPKAAMADHLSAAAEFKALDDGTGDLEGYASVFGAVDRQSDRVHPGAFAKTIADRARARTPLPLLADHVLSTEGVVGHVVDLREDGHGLAFRAKFAATQKAQDLRSLVIGGSVAGVSFGYRPVKYDFTNEAAGRVRNLREVALHEVSLTPWPANEYATVTAAKAGRPVDAEEEAVKARMLHIAVRLGVGYALEAAREEQKERKFLEDVRRGALVSKSLPGCQGRRLCGPCSRGDRWACVAEKEARLAAHRYALAAHVRHLELVERGRQRALAAMR